MLTTKFEVTMKDLKEMDSHTRSLLVLEAGRAYAVLMSREYSDDATHSSLNRAAFTISLFVGRCKKIRVAEMLVEAVSVRIDTTVRASGGTVIL